MGNKTKYVFSSILVEQTFLITETVYFVVDWLIVHFIYLQSNTILIKT